jgi:hypothetical protein
MDSLVQAVLDGKVSFIEDDIWHLTGMIQDLYREKPNVVKIPSNNLFFIGDLHGEIESAASIKRCINNYDRYFFVFLGDYADRGPAQVETINLVMALALAYPNRTLLLRGNHESEDVARRYGFYHEVLRSFSSRAFGFYTQLFANLPIAAYHCKTIFACHGGVPEGVNSIQEIQSRNRRDVNFPDEVISQMVWNDPQEGDFRFAPSIRGGDAKYFGQLAFDHFMDAIDARIMFRAHEVVPDGYRVLFQNRLFSIFSASYGGRVDPKILRLGDDGVVEPLPLRIS